MKTRRIQWEIKGVVMVKPDVERPYCSTWHNLYYRGKPCKILYRPNYEPTSFVLTPYLNEDGEGMVGGFDGSEITLLD